MAEFFSSDQLTGMATLDRARANGAPQTIALRPGPLAHAPSVGRGEPESRESRESTVAAGLLRTARPRQWVKNVLVFAAPAAAGALMSANVVMQTVVAFLTLSLAASGTYFLNDAQDVEADRRHPVKRHRPVAAGIVPVGIARPLGVGLMSLAIAVALAASGPGLAAVTAGYLALTLSYTLWLKHEPVLDIAAIAVGFVLRAVAGGAATGTPLSDWFLLVVSFGALFLATGKRFAELQSLGSSHGTRSSLAAYTAPYLRHVGFTSATLMILAYCAWVIRQAIPAWPLTLSILPLVLAVLRYALLLEQGEGEAPEELAFRDRSLQVLGVAWAALFLGGVYLL